MVFISIFVSPLGMLFPIMIINGKTQFRQNSNKNALSGSNGDSTTHLYISISFLSPFNTNSIPIAHQ
jgi:hypothetical protein